jgi:CRISPR system Cascade subunit CasE
MYLTRIELDLSKRKTLKVFSAPNLLHGAIENSFKGDRKRNLWRIDKLHDSQYLLIVSNDIPDTDLLVDQFGVLNTAETRDYQKLLDRITVGDIWNFKLVANPTNSIKTEENSRGKVVAHIGVHHQKEWLVQKSAKNGFYVDLEDFQVTGSQWYSFKKKEKGARITMLAVTYIGTLKVTDAELFKNALINGIGREKAYGMGLLTIVNRRSS